MSDEWLERLREVVAKDPRKPRAISTAAENGPNYLEQTLKKENKNLAKFVRLLRTLGPNAAVYVITGMNVDEEDIEFLEAVLAVSGQERPSALAFAKALKGQPASPSDEHADRDLEPSKS